MAAHILTMNVVAPMLAIALLAARPRTAGDGLGLAAAMASQLVLLWAWHAPPVLDGIAHTPLGLAAMHLSLSAAALWFWLAVLSDRSALRWRALMALALTGKLFCLLGVLLVFAPRMLYAAHAAAPVFSSGDALADQQLAGLMMVVACPLSYVLAAVVIAARGLRDIAASAPSTSAAAR
jgi:putative membrane protein